MQLLYRMYPRAQDYWDGNWIQCKVSAPVGNFRAEFKDALHLSDVTWLLKIYKDFYSTLKGESEWEFMDFWCSIRSSMTQGNVNWQIELQHPAGMGTKLIMAIKSDQSYLPPLITDLEHTLLSYPLRGLDQS